MEGTFCEMCSKDEHRERNRDVCGETKVRIEYQVGKEYRIVCIWAEVYQRTKLAGGGGGETPYTNMGELRREKSVE